MKKHIARILTVVMLAVLVLSMGTTFAGTVYFKYYNNYYPYNEEITDWTLTKSKDIGDSETFYASSIVPAYYYNNGVKSGTPYYVTGSGTLFILVTKKTSTTPTTTYYNYGNSGIIPWNGTDSYILMGYSDYLYPQTVLANPIPTVAVGGVVPVTQNMLGGLLPSNIHLTFSSANTAIANTTGPIVYGVAPGTTKLNVYYDSTWILSRDITVSGSATTTTSANLVSASNGLVIGPDTYTSAKNKKYTLAPKVDGSSVKATTLKWTSTNTKVATVSSSGIVLTRKAGTATIIAESKDGQYIAAVDFIVQ